MLVAIVLTCVGLLTALTSADGASSGTVVGATVPSATTLSSTGCSSGVAGLTDFGSILPGASMVTTSDCVVTFGSSNDTARLRVRQTDASGEGMHQQSRGAPDSSFSGDGLASVAVAGMSSTPLAVEVQPDGKVLAGGYCAMGGATGDDFCLARFEEDGDLDTTGFGGGAGTVTTSFSAAGVGDRIEDLEIQPDGRIVALGSCPMGATGWDACVARYLTNGMPDPAFGTNGSLTIAASTGAGLDSFTGIALQPDGRIVLGGYCTPGGGTGRDLCVMRLQASGTLDTTFSHDGIASIAVAPGAGNDTGSGVIIQPNGSIVVGGSCAMGGATGNDACVAALTSAGAIDTSFGGGDAASTLSFLAPANSENAYSLAGDGRGGIAVLNWCYDSGSGTGDDMCVARFDSTGSPVATFDGDGMKVLSIAPADGDDIGSSIAFQPDGALILAGYCEYPSPRFYDLCVARIDASGALETSFDDDGVLVIEQSPTLYDDYPEGMSIGKDGTILIANDCGYPATDPFCINRLAAGGSFSQYVSGSTDWDTVDTSLFGACLASITSGTPSWTTNATCPATDGPHWNALPSTPVQVATANANTSNATAAFRFGLRAAPNQPPGAYVAGMTFDVLAP